ncbi:unnamed protein product [Cuscuta campestris]|uniref:CCHC-type domain-containing protein n=1 Tax=Cuscuta campestris TaxID=132261 RepID=A0A484NCR0_9ASTE|nr:unnamed protein product [Cuscuta campestris]
MSNESQPMSHEELVTSNAAINAQVEYLAKEVAKLTKIKLSTLQGSDHEDDASTSSTTKAKTNDGSDFKVDIPTFEGRNDPDEFLEWLEMVERVFDFKEVSDEKKVKIVALKFRKYASTWWTNTCTKRRRNGKKLVSTWTKMRSLLKKKFLPAEYIRENFAKLQTLKQGYDDWKIMMEAHLYALHDCMWMVLEDGPLKIQMENPERNPANPDVVQYIPKPKEKWDDRDCKKHNLDNVAKAAIFKTLDPITFSKIKHLKTAMEIWQGLGKLCEGSEDLRKQKIEVLLEKFKSFKMLPGESFDMLDERFHKIINDLASLNHVLSPKEKNVRTYEHELMKKKEEQGLLDELRTYEHELMKKKEEQGLLDELRTYEHELMKKKEELHCPRNDPDEIQEWLETVERVFDFKEVSDEKKVKIVALKFRKYASKWWTNTCTKRRRNGKEPVSTWTKMRSLLKKKFLPAEYVRENFAKLQTLKQGSKSVEDYNREFEELLLMCDLQEDDEQTFVRYLFGLNLQIANTMELQSYETLEELTKLALKVEAQIKKSKSLFPKPNPTYARPNPISQKTTYYPSKTPPTAHGQTPNSSTPTPSKNPSSSFPTGADPIKKAPICFRCQRRGHYANECPNKKVMAIVECDEEDCDPTWVEEEVEEADEQDEYVGPDDDFWERNAGVCVGDGWENMEMMKEFFWYF